MRVNKVFEKNVLTFV